MSLPLHLKDPLSGMPLPTAAKSCCSLQNPAQFLPSPERLLWVASCLENRGLLTQGVVSEIRLVVPNRELALKSTSSYYALTTPQPLNHSPPPKPSRSISIISRNPKVYVVGRLMPSPQQRCSHPNFQSLQVCSLM